MRPYAFQVGDQIWIASRKEAMNVLEAAIDHEEIWPGDHGARLAGVMIGNLTTACQSDLRMNRVILSIVPSCEEPPREPKRGKAT